jgi:hypothetical protein
MKKAAKGFVILILTLFFLPFIITPAYDFPDARPFSGDKIWNPYQNIDTNHWQRANFQVQSRAWGGVTDGSNNTFDKVWNTYRELGYSVIGISDYMKINKMAEDSSGYIPIYEHGYNIRKTHQVSIGAKEVTWLDFVFYQTVNHKQFLINLQRDKTEILALVHPAFSLEGYSKDDLRKLTNYDLIEPLNQQKYSFAHWDAALSAGNPVYLLADDDVHDIDDPLWYGRIVTYINSPDNSAKNIIAALKNGKAYGYSPYTPDGDTKEKKVKRFKNLHELKEVKVKGDTLFVRADPGIYEIRFIGQNGKTLKKINNQNSGYYVFKPSDTYVRTEIDYKRDEVMYLNPVIRYSGDKPAKRPVAKVNLLKTIIYNLFFGLLYIFIIYLIVKKW